MAVEVDQATFSACDGAASAIASARRAALADRYAASSLAVEWRELAQLEPFAEQWRELAARTLEPNVFYEPAFALAAAPVLGRDAGVVLVWSGSSPRRLLGLFPGRIQSRRYGLKLPVLIGWTHPYGPLGTPLVDREAAEPVIAAWLGFLSGDAAMPGLMLLPFISEHGPFAVALGAVLRRRQLPSLCFNRHRRALFAPRGDRSEYIAQALGAHRHKELRRVGRRLAEKGALMFTTATEAAAIADAIESFFTLEASGWKGREGTAALHHAGIRGFIANALLGLAGGGQVSLDRILLDGCPVAASITLRSGATAWFWKIAYDEKLARYSPGVMLTVAVTERLLDDEAVEQCDSCAAANHPMIDHIWRERLALCDLFVAPKTPARFQWAGRLETLRRAAITTAKALQSGRRR